MNASQSMHLPLALLLLATAGTVQAEGPVYHAAPCCSLCPAAHDASRYTTSYQQNFVTLVEAQGDWLFRTREDLRTEFQTTSAGYRRLQQLHDAFQRKGIELVMVYQPTRGLINRNKLDPAEMASFNYQRALTNYRAMLGRFRDMGYTVPDLSVLANEQEDHAFFFRGDQHWTPYGAQRTAKLVAETVKQMPAYKGIPKREFASKVVGRMGKKGTLHNVASQLCGGSYAIEYMDQFATEPKDASDGEALFSEAGDPQIYLIGTSQSAQNYNFDGFLSEYLSADIYNAAVPGGGFEGALLQLLGSKEFRENPPKIIIWEFSPLYRLDQESTYRQLFAMLDNGCVGKPAVLSAKTKLRPGTNEVLVNGGGGLKNVRNAQYQVDVRYADPTVKTMQATLWHLNGRRETLKLDKPKTVDTDGRFAFELRTDSDWADMVLLSLELQGPPAGSPPQEVEVKVCQRNRNAGPAQHTAQTEP
ncbi:alginate O-acetyltransferase [Pseudomonas taiwanensis]|uniref:alginate O-acetyltransferase n=1 Tax=Pseudomonas taiwanensis TaxID=470150 RepID=UPI0015C0F2B5|nr:alginate O-acetyltransferase [Pseudomonas taiwanensis]NWL76446.1 alginate O-acetyltransferase [Pseudomonas taiwanensis]